ncbi:MAG: hypothetical protein HFJ04_01825 [Lachnospiraceae bacterium]|nr:hypothetical protein [Lachnospiraceae bacterium]
MANQFRGCIFLAAICLFCLLPQRVSAAGTEKVYNLNKKKTVTISNEDSYEESGKYTWLKYKASSDGYLKIQVSAPKSEELEDGRRSAGYIALYNDTMTRLLSSKSIFYNTAYSGNKYWGRFFFGMQKGKTYYIRVKAENKVKFTREFKKVTDKSGSSRKTAKKLNKNKTRTGLIRAGDSKVDWYKIELSKKQKIRIFYTARTSGSFRISFYTNKKIIARRNIYNTVDEQKLTLVQYTDSKTKKVGLEKGVYYIKVERANALSSGYYKLKWN